MKLGLILLLAIMPVSMVTQGNCNPLKDVIPFSSDDDSKINKVLQNTQNFNEPEKYEVKSAGAATVRVRKNNNVFSQPSSNISFDKQLDFKVGNGLFKKLWVSSPSSTLASDGLGPLFNARSCQRCHLKDGRGHPPEPNDNSNVSIVVKLGLPINSSYSFDDKNAEGEIHEYLTSLPEPTYGNQIQDFAVLNNKAEANYEIDYEYFNIFISGDEKATLRKPRIRFVQKFFGPFHSDTMFSLRVAPQMIGLGLIEAIPVEQIQKLADPSDSDGDGVSGRINSVWSEEYERYLIGRFGYKASKGSLKEQVAFAFSNDIGISTTIFPNAFGDCTKKQKDCRNSPNGKTVVHDKQEISDEALDLVTFYAGNLGVPARRNVDNLKVLKGKQIFNETGCNSCHNAKFVTHRMAYNSPQSFQLIWPYSDFLLHDMGEGLADGFEEGEASAQEWRTPPLWGIGLTNRVSGHTYFLHDGRARNLLEAILWHGGEAVTHVQKVIAMPPGDRRALISFLESL